MAIEDKIFKHDIKILEKCKSKKPFNLFDLIADCLIIAGIMALGFFILWFLIGQIVEVAARI